jgi:anaerobic selenocysteine-containing dehydrogenase
VSANPEPDWDPIVAIDRAAFEPFWRLGQRGLREALASTKRSLLLTTESSLYQYTSAVMTRKVDGLNILSDHELVEINPKDAIARGIADGERVRVISRRGELRAQARVTDVPPAGVLSMNIHFAESLTNLLTNPVLDPVAKTPETKICAVRIEKLKGK